MSYEKDREIALLKAEIEAAWFGIEHAFDIESRELIERESKTNGFKFGLAQAVHTIWKREPKVAALIAALNRIDRDDVSERVWDEIQAALGTPV
jgi:hypothetical protein